ncbi:hypothetical protein HRG_002242 [Hirsutella rhossiliensis]|uniref:Uncharacterized protein n=1 Tax=Hirsutella rhossiliensis TaxID=111463 RepID=A0A9P8N239_9HYPO|nr:uncharacterized protein HRG_02242 [Hirsutella rhossiliensis]KAH0966833.1 hypothetical protein HRG_02242 [Hirsutella rhossiliensis]
MSTRPLSSALRSLGGCHGPSGRLMACPWRQFSSTPTRAVSAIFSETENVELNAILKNIQETIILPAYLPEKQRRIVFDPKKRTYMEQNPIVIDVEGLEHKFSTIDRFKDIENSKKLLAQALSKMQSPAEWSNLATLLAGYRKAGIRLQADHWGKMVRMAGETGNIQAIIECAKQADKTGFSLGRRETAVRTLVYINEKASRQMHAHALGALRAAEVVLDMLQRPEHARAAKRTRNSLPFSRIIRGITLFTRSAACNVKLASRDEGVDQDLLLLEDEVALFRSLWKGPLPDDLTQLREFAELNATLDRNSGRKIPRALNGFCYVQALAQGIRGTILAEELLGDKAKDLARVREALEKHVHEFVQTAPGRSQGWIDEYELVTGKRLELQSAPKQEPDKAPAPASEQENSV